MDPGKENTWEPQSTVWWKSIKKVLCIIWSTHSSKMNKLAKLGIAQADFLHFSCTWQLYSNPCQSVTQGPFHKSKNWYLQGQLHIYTLNICLSSWILKIGSISCVFNYGQSGRKFLHIADYRMKKAASKKRAAKEMMMRVALTLFFFTLKEMMMRAAFTLFFFPPCPRSGQSSPPPGCSSTPVQSSPELSFTDLTF